MNDVIAVKRSKGLVCVLDNDEARPATVAHDKPAVIALRTWYLAMIAVRRGRGKATVAAAR